MLTMKTRDIPMTGLGVLFFTAVILGECTTAYALEIQGHRGARAVFPENTLPSFEHALLTGADTLELDLGLTKGGTPDPGPHRDGGVPL
jgi:glycerophosphoryl diester phosphodiesterase